jgi:hypothetical protein
MHVSVTEMEEVNSRSSRSTVSTLPVSAFQPRPLSKTKSWRAAVLSKIGTSTGAEKGSMETELEGMCIPMAPDAKCNLTIMQRQGNKEPPSNSRLSRRDSV